MPVAFFRAGTRVVQPMRCEAGRARLPPGIPSALVSLPLRYMHSVVEVAHCDHIQKVIDLLTGFVEAVTETDVFGVSL